MMIILEVGCGGEIFLKECQSTKSEGKERTAQSSLVIQKKMFLDDGDNQVNHVAQNTGPAGITSFWEWSNGKESTFLKNVSPLSSYGWTITQIQKDIPLNHRPVLSTKDNVKKHKTTKGGGHSTLKETEEQLSLRAVCLLDRTPDED